MDNRTTRSAATWRISGEARRGRVAPDLQVGVEVVEGAGVAAQEPLVLTREAGQHGSKRPGLPATTATGPVDLVVDLVGEQGQRMAQDGGGTRRQRHRQAGFTPAIGALRAVDAIVAALAALLAPTWAVGGREQQDTTLTGGGQLPATRGAAGSSRAVPSADSTSRMARCTGSGAPYSTAARRRSAVTCWSTIPLSAAASMVAEGASVRLTSTSASGPSPRSTTASTTCSVAL